MKQLIHIHGKEYFLLTENSDLEKAKKAAIGETATWADGKTYRKVSESNWEPVSDHDSRHRSGSPTGGGGAGGADKDDVSTPSKLHEKFRVALESMSSEHRALFRGGKMDFDKKTFSSPDGKISLHYKDGKVTASKMEKADDPNFMDDVSVVAGSNFEIGSFDLTELAMGIQVEMEHTDDVEVAWEIATDHLDADKKYYSKLMASGLIDEDLSNTSDIIEILKNIEAEYTHESEQVMNKARTVKYVRRIPKASGKGYTYIYAKKNNSSDKNNNEDIQKDKSEDEESIKKELKEIERKDFPDKIDIYVNAEYIDVPKKGIKAGIEIYGEKIFIVKDGKGFKAFEQKTGKSLGYAGKTIEQTKQNVLDALRAVGKKNFKTAIENQVANKTKNVKNRKNETKNKETEKNIDTKKNADEKESNNLSVLKNILNKNYGKNGYASKYTDEEIKDTSDQWEQNAIEEKNPEKREKAKEAASQGRDMLDYRKKFAKALSDEVEPNKGNDAQEEYDLATSRITDFERNHDDDVDLEYEEKSAKSDMEDEPVDSKIFIDAFKELSAINQYRKDVAAIPQLKEKAIEESGQGKMFKASLRLEQALLKAKKAPVGEVRTYANGKKYRKEAEGKWVEVKGEKKGKGNDEEKKPEDKKKDEEKKSKNEGEKGWFTETLKKVANVLAEALKGRDTVTPVGQAVETAGDKMKGKNTQQPPEKDKSKEKVKLTGNPQEKNKDEQQKRKK